MTQIVINNRIYFFKTVSRGEFNEYLVYKFYIKEMVVKKHIKRKYLFFGPIVQERTEVVEEFTEAFYVYADDNDCFCKKKVKELEERYNLKKELFTGRVEI